MAHTMTPSYVNIFKGDLEQFFLAQAPYQPLSWLRFIDDVEKEMNSIQGKHGRSHNNHEFFQTNHQIRCTNLRDTFPDITPTWERVTTNPSGKSI